MPNIKIFIAFILLSSPSVAQQVNIKAAGGINYTRLGGGFAQVLDIRSVPGYSIGVQAEIAINEKLWVQPEIFISGRGYSYIADYYLNRERHNLLFMDLPVTINYKVLKSFYVMGGPQFSYLTNSNKHINALNYYSIGLVVGVREDLNKNISIGFRYMHGISNIFREFDPRNFPVNLTIREDSRSSPERYFQVFISYRFFSIE
ncbi:MAG: porin family protein [Cytophagaceae bacterium]